jgi:hypothetical protein
MPYVKHTIIGTTATGGALAFTGFNGAWEILAGITLICLAGLIFRFVPRKPKA